MFSVLKSCSVDKYILDFRKWSVVLRDADKRFTEVGWGGGDVNSADLCNC